MRRNARRQRGAALLLTLVAIAILAVLAATMGNLVVGHLHRADTDQDAAKALNFAEAALNFQIQKISANIYGPQEAYDSTRRNVATATYGTSDSPYPVGEAVVTAGGPQATLGAVLDLGDNDTCTSWVHPAFNIYTTSTVFLYGQATVGRVLRPDGSVEIEGVTRTVRARGTPVGVFDYWAGFGVERLVLNGSGIRVQGSSGIKGAIGTNGFLEANGNPLVEEITLHGVPRSNSQLQMPEPLLRAKPIKWPTVGEIADYHAAYCRNYSGPTVPPPYATSSTFTINQGIANFDGTNNDNGFARLEGTSAFPADGNIPPGATVTLRGKHYAANYYMTGLRCGGSNGRLAVDMTTGGSVNLWIDSSAIEATGNDAIRQAITVTGNPTWFRIYYRNAQPSGKLVIRGSAAMTVPGMVYAFDQDTRGSYSGTVEVGGGVTARGSLIANTLNLIGDNIRIDFPSNLGAGPGEALLYYGIMTPWQEVSPLRGY